ncbi:MAG: aminotransferase class III-fold pyridoxal phosphate-dependent enzyme [Bacillus subtilis]|nr:aminotransferase class III-fold pyridoxal phosphate-dependent enzyme [Bacillus subtilis]
MWHSQDREAFGFENYEIEPDVIALAKGLGGGFPIGAMLAKDNIAQAFQPGDHASTFGGNPLACTAGKTVINSLLKDNMLKNIQEHGKYLEYKLEELRKIYNFIIDRRGIGLMQGIELDIPVTSIIQKAMDNGLLFDKFRGKGYKVRPAVNNT